MTTLKDKRYYMVHRLKHNDVIKILPFITEDNKIYWGKSYDVLAIGTKAIFDDTGMLNKICRLYNTRNDLFDESSDPKHRMWVRKKHYFHCYVNGESKLVGIGRTLFTLISNMKLDVSDNQHLLIDEEMKENHFGPTLPSYDKSRIIECDWNPPVSDIDSKEEWVEWLKSNQPVLSRYSNSLMNNRSELIDKFGSDLYAEVIQNERSEKLEKILN